MTPCHMWLKACYACVILRSSQSTKTEIPPPAMPGMAPESGDLMAPSMVKWKWKREKYGHALWDILLQNFQYPVSGKIMFQTCRYFVGFPKMFMMFFVSRKGQMFSWFNQGIPHLRWRLGILWPDFANMSDASALPEIPKTGAIPKCLRVAGMRFVYVLVLKKRKDASDFFSVNQHPMGSLMIAEAIINGHHISYHITLNKAYITDPDPYNITTPS